MNEWDAGTSSGSGPHMSKPHASKPGMNAAGMNGSGSNEPIQRCTTGTPITLFTELDTAPLIELLDGSDVHALWDTGRFSLAVAMLDLSAERASAIHAVEARGVEVTAWLLLDAADGYWLNADNADLAAARFRELDDFANEHGLRLPRIGLDIEPPRADMDLLLRDGLPALVRLIRRRRDRAEIDAAEASYANLCRVIRRSGRRVESYCLPPIIDEVRVGSTLLRRILGIVDPPVDDRVLMAYSTYLGVPMTLSYLRASRAGAIGVTGGGVYADKDGPRVLGWKQVRAQLDWASSGEVERPRRLYVFSLEGCAQSGMLPQLAAWQPGPQAGQLTRALAGDLARGALRLLLRSEGLLDRLRPVKQGAQRRPNQPARDAGPAATNAQRSSSRRNGSCSPAAR